MTGWLHWVRSAPPTPQKLLQESFSEWYLYVVCDVFEHIFMFLSSTEPVSTVNWCSHVFEEQTIEKREGTRKEYYKESVVLKRTNNWKREGTRKEKYKKPVVLKGLFTEICQYWKLMWRGVLICTGFNLGKKGNYLAVWYKMLNVVFNDVKH